MLTSWCSVWIDVVRGRATLCPGRSVRPRCGIWRRGWCRPNGRCRDLIGCVDQLDELAATADQPGIAELKAEAEAAGIPTGLVTNSFRRLISMVLKSTGLHFDVTVGKR